MKTMSICSISRMQEISRNERRTASETEEFHADSRAREFVRLRTARLPSWQRDEAAYTRAFIICSGQPRLRPAIYARFDILTRFFRSRIANTLPEGAAPATPRR